MGKVSPALSGGPAFGGGRGTFLPRGWWTRPRDPGGIRDRCGAGTVGTARPPNLRRPDARGPAASTREHVAGPAPPALGRAAPGDRGSSISRSKPTPPQIHSPLTGPEAIGDEAASAGLGVSEATNGRLPPMGQASTCRASGPIRVERVRQQSPGHSGGRAFPAEDEKHRRPVDAHGTATSAGARRWTAPPRPPAPSRRSASSSTSMDSTNSATSMRSCGVWSRLLSPGP